jgi:hypothetical protein
LTLHDFLPDEKLREGEWNFPDAPLRALYARNRVYEGVNGMQSFWPWLERNLTDKVMADFFTAFTSSGFSPVTKLATRTSSRGCP